MEFEDTINCDFYRLMERRQQQLMCEEHVRPLLRMMTEIKNLYATCRITVAAGHIISVESTLPSGAQGQYDAIADAVTQIRKQYEQ